MEIIKSFNQRFLDNTCRFRNQSLLLTDQNMTNDPLDNELDENLESFRVEDFKLRLAELKINGRNNEN